MRIYELDNTDMSGGIDQMERQDKAGKNDMDLIRHNKIVIRLFISYALLCVMWNHICYGFAHWASRSPPKVLEFVCRHYTESGSMAGRTSPSSSSPEYICISVYACWL